jgi:hypothetical protein
MMSKCTVFIAVVATLLGIEQAKPATFSLELSVGATHHPETGALQSTGFIADSTPHIYRVDLIAHVSGLAPGESFGVFGYDMRLNGLMRNTLNLGGTGGGLINPKPNYVPDNPTTSLFSAVSESPLFDYYTGGANGDFGPSSSDLIGMLTAIEPFTLGNLVDENFVPQPDPRQTIGLGAGTRLGALYVKWDGTSFATLSIINGLFTEADPINRLHYPPDPVPDSVLVFNVVVAEPATLILGVPMGIGLFVFRRRAAMRSISRS